MPQIHVRVRYLIHVGALVVAGVAGGCQAIHPGCESKPHATAASLQVQNVVPQELKKAALPTYKIEPPDLLMVDALHVVPRPPYYLRTLDAVSIVVQGTLPDAPIAGNYTVEPGGLIKLGFAYGSVQVGGMTVDEAQKAIERHLREFLKEPIVTASLASMAATQQITGEHLVGPDGTVTLGIYGSVPVVGMTIAEAKKAIESHLAQSLENPEVAVDVFAYNSKVYYVVTQGAGTGDQISRFPITGNETVLDAISQVSGLQQVSSKRIWIARPTDIPGKVQVLPVNWDAITAQACTSTNYQVLPGDRVFIAESKLMALDNAMARITAPIERASGFSLLGVGTISRFSGRLLRGGGNQNNNF